MPCQFVTAVNGAASSRAGSPITSGPYNSYHPTLAADTGGNFFVAFDGSQDGVVYLPVFTASTDGGQTWGDGAFFQGTEGASRPNVDYKTAKGFYGTFDPSPDASGMAWLVDATDLGNVQGASWDFSADNFDSFGNSHIATYTHAGPVDDGAWNFGGLTFTGYNGYNGASIIGCPFVLYEYDVNGGGVIGWLNGADGCVHSSSDIDQVTNMSYSVYDRNVSGTYQLLVRKDNFGKWTNQGTYYSHPMVTTKAITAAGNLMYPDVIADQNKVLVVAQYNNAGNQDIVCYYSTNGMSSNTKSTVVNSADNELYPKISWVKTGVAVCTYIKGTEAFYKVSTDGGATWGAEARVSDEQISSVDNKALATFGNSGNTYAIWQDGRGAQTDIYWDLFYQVASPNVQIGTVKGGIGKVTMDVLNTGTGAATNVAWSITVKGGIFGRINVTTTGVIANLDASGSQTVQTDKFMFGLGKLTVGLTAGPATAAKTGKIFLIKITVT